MRERDLQQILISKASGLPGSASSPVDAIGRPWTALSVLTQHLGG